MFFSGLISGIMLATTKATGDHHIALIGEWAFVIFENGIRIGVSLLGFYYTLRYLRETKQRISTFRRVSFLSFTISSLIIYLFLPLYWGFTEFYNGVMPILWSTLPFSGPYTGHAGSIDLNGVIHPVSNGVAITLLVYNVYQIITFTGTLFLGRRWHCSMICTMAGVHAEAFGLVLPQKPHNKTRPQSKQINKTWKTILLISQIYLLLISVALFVLWWIFIANGTVIISVETMITLERVNHYIFSLIGMSLIWVIVGARGYCVYCPAGTLLGGIGQLVGQEIQTNLTKCIGCGKCNDACKMSIDIQRCAQEKIPLKSIYCVGCGNCIDACPTQNLRYSTWFLRKIAGRNSKSP